MYDGGLKAHLFACVQALLAIPALPQITAGYDRGDEEGSQKCTERGSYVHGCGVGFASSVFVVQREMLAQLRIMISL